MTELKERNTFENSREHLANERTFLAWIRTNIALMDFGFVIVKNDHSKTNLLIW
jgi:uncharacterized membrane protein YidH (DUF202 family)